MCFFPEKMMEAYKGEIFSGEGKTLFIYFFGIMGIMMGCSHFVHGVVPKGSRSPGMKTLEPQPPQVTILSGFFALSVSSDTIREI